MLGWTDVEEQHTVTGGLVMNHEKPPLAVMTTTYSLYAVAEHELLQAFHRKLHAEVRDPVLA